MKEPKVQRANERLRPTVLKLARAIEHRLPSELRYCVLVFGMDEEDEGMDVGIAGNSSVRAAIIAMAKVMEEMEKRNAN